MAQPGWRQLDVLQRIIAWQIVRYPSGLYYHELLIKLVDDIPDNFREWDFHNVRITGGGHDFTVHFMPNGDGSVSDRSRVMTQVYDQKVTFSWLVNPAIRHSWIRRTRWTSFVFESGLWVRSGADASYLDLGLPVPVKARRTLVFNG